VPPLPLLQTKRTSTVKTALLAAVHNCLGSLPGLEYTLVRDPNGINGGEDGSRPQHQGGMGAGVAEQQAARAVAAGGLGGMPLTMMGAAAGMAAITTGV
jgi:hypothetical protein